MGMDSLELLIDIEKAFSISIPDQEAEKIITVGDFHNVVWKHVEGREGEKCKSQSLFYILRKGFQQEFNVPRNEIRPGGSVSELFPEQDRRRAYYAFAESTGLKLPDLVLTRPWYLFLNGFGIATIIGGLGISILLAGFWNYSQWIFLLPVAGIIYTILISDVLDPKRTVIESGQLRQFTKRVLANNFAELAKETGLNRKEVESVINYIISDRHGIDLDEITPEKKIGDDLGIS